MSSREGERDLSFTVIEKSSIYKSFKARKYNGFELF